MSNSGPRYLLGHRRALQVPARPAAAPRASARSVSGSPGLCAFHSAKSRGSRLRSSVVGVGGRLQVVELLPGQRAVGRGRSGRRSRRRRRRRRRARASISRCISSTISRDVPGGPRLVGGRQAARGRRRRAVNARSFVVRPRPPRHAVRRGLGEDLVVDVGDVADEGDVEPAGGQPAAQHVEGERGADVADVRRALHGGPADVDRRLPGTQRREVADRTGGRVVQAEAHCGGVYGAPAAARSPRPPARWPPRPGPRRGR